MMSDDRENNTLDAARQSLDESVEQMPDKLSNALAAARARAMASAQALDSNATGQVDTESNVVSLRPHLDKNRMVWSGAIAASCAALALTLTLRQPGTEEFLPLEVEGTYALEAEDSMLFLAEMDNTEWELVQELEFALWLSEFGDEASSDFSG